MKTKMPSFAVNRFEQNKGEGVRPGVWKFDPFMFADSLFGRVTVEYEFDPSDIPEFLGGKFTIVIMDDDGNDLTDPIPGGIMADFLADAFHAFCEQREAVIDFEMGLL